MNDIPVILLVEDEPLILMDLEFAAEDAGLDYLSAANLSQAMEHIDQTGGMIDLAILDFSLTAGENCLPIANELNARGIPFVIHSGDLDRHDELIRSLNVPRLAKPISSDRVVATALSLLPGGDGPRAVAAR